MLPQGLEFIITILAIFKAGKIAIPHSIPKRKNSINRLLSILKDVSSKDIICSEIEVSRILKKFNENKINPNQNPKFEALMSKEYI